MKNSADQGRPKAEVDNTFQDLQNSSYPKSAEFTNCFIIYNLNIFNSFKSLKGENKLFVFLLTKNNTNSSPGFLG